MPMRPIHPGEIIAEDILKELNFSPRQLAEFLHVPTRRFSDIIHGLAPVTADFAMRMAQWLGATPDFWLDVQIRYDLETAKQTVGDEIKRTVRPLQSAT